MYSLHTNALLWEKEQGIYQPPDPSTLLVGFLPAGHYPVLTIKDFFEAGSKGYLCLELAGKGTHDWEFYVTSRSGSPSWTANELMKTLNITSLSNVIHLKVEATIHADGNTTIHRQVLPPTQREKRTYEPRKDGIMGWGNY